MRFLKNLIIDIKKVSYRIIVISIKILLILINETYSITLHLYDKYLSPALKKIETILYIQACNIFDLKK